MGGRRWLGAVACAGLLVVPACSRADAADCGPSERVVVDLGEALTEQPGQYLAQVCLDEPLVCRSLGFASDGSEPMVTSVDADLTGGPVGVRVTVTASAGTTVYSAIGVATPRDRGDGDDCEAFVLQLAAAPDGSLRPDDDAVLG